MSSEKSFFSTDFIQSVLGHTIISVFIILISRDFLWILKNMDLNFKYQRWVVFSCFRSMFRFRPIYPAISFLPIRSPYCSSSSFSSSVTSSSFNTTSSITASPSSCCSTSSSSSTTFSSSLVVLLGDCPADD